MSLESLKSDCEEDGSNTFSLTRASTYRGGAALGFLDWCFSGEDDANRKTDNTNHGEMMNMNLGYLLDYHIILVLIWGLIGLGFIPWLFSKSSGWFEVKRLPFRTRMLLSVPFYRGWRSGVDPGSLESLGIWRRRNLVWGCFCISGQAIIWSTLWLRFFT